jgi:hypothetical protein
MTSRLRHGGDRSSLPAGSRAPGAEGAWHVENGALPFVVLPDDE